MRKGWFICAIRYLWKIMYSPRHLLIHAVDAFC